MDAWETKIMEVLGRKDCCFVSIVKGELGVRVWGRGGNTYAELRTHYYRFDGGN